jgi:hypothetical protein
MCAITYGREVNVVYPEITVYYKIRLQKCAGAEYLKLSCFVKETSNEQDIVLSGKTTFVITVVFLHWSQ